MEWVETTGRTVEEAKKLALDQLGVAEPDAEFEIVTEPRLGLFGRLKEEARVRARVRPRFPRAKIDRRDRRRGRGQSEGRADRPALPPTASAPVDRAAAETRPPRAGKAGPPGAKERAVAGPAQAAGRRAARPRQKKPEAQPAPRANSQAGPASFGDVEEVPVEEQARFAEEFLRGLLDQLGAGATITWGQQAEGIIEVEVAGEDLGTLIGPKGATLLALQELTRSVVQRKSGLGGSRLLIDINGYRKRRQEALARFAREVANEVRESGRKRALEPMPPADRKVVHDAVNELEGVSTISEGEEPRRRVVLIPASSAATDKGGSSGTGANEPAQTGEATLASN